MFKLRTRLFGTNFESTFPHPVAFNQPYLAKVGESLSQSLSPTGLTPNQIECVTLNVLFGYEIRFPLFRGNASFSLNSQRLRLDFMNAVGPADVTTIIDTVLKCLQPIDLPWGTNHSISVGRQAEFEAPGDFDEFFSPQGTKWQTPAVKQVGAMLYLKLPEWDEEITLFIERSLVLPRTGVFVNTRTFLKERETHLEEAKSGRPKAITTDTLGRVAEIFDRAANACNLEFLWP